jgi:hypothetical protein
MSEPERWEIWFIGFWAMHGFLTVWMDYGYMEYGMQNAGLGNKKFWSP